MTVRVIQNYNIDICNHFIDAYNLNKSCINYHNVNKSLLITYAKIIKIVDL